MLRRDFVIVLLFTYQLNYGHTTRDIHPDYDLKTPALAKKYGYPLEIHKAITKDGYILEMHRIPYGRNAGGTRQSRSAVLLQHGLAGSSADWIFMGPGRSLGYYLADAGFDIWMGNNRGNVYSRNHTTMLPSDRDFWDFSYHELGLYDMPAMIDYILHYTNSKRLLYVGHSQGTTQFLVMTSLRPEYNSKISLMTGLAPAAFTGSLRGPVTKLATLTYFGVWVGENFGYPEMGPRSSWAKFISNLLCSNHVPTKLFCTNGLFLVAGLNRKDWSRENITVIMGHIPAGASWKQVIHYGQGYINPGYFRMFDYGDPKKNFRLYDSAIPPEYAVEKIRTPIALFSSPDDWLAGTDDVELLTDRLQNLVFHQKIENINFNHYDFIWGKDAKQQVFYPLLRLLQEYRHNDRY